MEDRWGPASSVFLSCRTCIDIGHESTLSLTLLLGWTAAVSAQDIPSVELKDLADMTVDTRAFVEEAEGPVLFCFWATWCSPCKRELNNYADLYPDWQDETGVELVAVSIDDPGA